MTDSDKALSTALLVIYIVLAPVAAYCTYRHGFKVMSALGWGYLIAFCALKIIGSAMQLSNPTSVAATIVTSIGLSPLLLAIGGVVHEARYFRATLQGAVERFERFIILAFHGLIIAGVVLLAIGVSNLSSADSSTTSDEIDKDWSKARTGAGLLFAAWIVIALFATVSIMPTGRGSSHHQTARQVDGTRLLVAVLAALPFLGVRVLTSLVYFVSKDATINPSTGSIGVRVGLYYIEEIITTLLLLGAGVLTRNIRQLEVQSGEEWVDASEMPRRRRK